MKILQGRDANSWQFLSGDNDMRNRGLVRIATLTGIFIVALLISQMLPQIAGMVGGK